MVFNRFYDAIFYFDFVHDIRTRIIYGLLVCCNL